MHEGTACCANMETKQTRVTPNTLDNVHASGSAKDRYVRDVDDRGGIEPPALTRRSNDVIHVYCRQPL